MGLISPISVVRRGVLMANTDEIKGFRDSPQIQDTSSQNFHSYNIFKRGCMQLKWTPPESSYVTDQGLPGDHETSTQRAEDQE
jgi:hypothetical protein